MDHLPTIYGAAVLLPLASFFVILVFAQQLGRFAGWVATSAILIAGMLSFLALGTWLTHHFPAPVHHAAHSDAHEGGGEHPHDHDGHKSDDHKSNDKKSTEKKS